MDVYFHKYNKTERFIKSNIIGPLIEFGFILLSIFWTLAYIIFQFSWILFSSVLLVLLAFSIWFFYIVFIKFYEIKINKYNLDLKKLSKPISFVFVSDLHIGKERSDTNLKRLKIIVNKINNLNPELVIFGGDFVGMNYEKDILEELKNIKAKYKFGVYGNHDSLYLKEKQQSELPVEGIQTIEEMGIKLLNNEGIELTIDGTNLYFAGITDMFSLNFDIKKAFANAPKGLPRILISHNPDIIKFAQESDQIDLILSGHSHSGQIHIPVIGPVLPMPVENKKLTRGIFKVGTNTTLFISQGCGYSGTRVRVGTDCEICELTIS